MIVSITMKTVFIVQVLEAIQRSLFAALKILQKGTSHASLCLSCNKHALTITTNFQPNSTFNTRHAKEATLKTIVVAVRVFS
jgi:hypothetical protein